MKILWIDACVREDSRTRTLARRVLSHLSGEVKRVVLDTQGPMPLTGETLGRRLSFQAQGDFSDPMFAWARDFAAADIILVASPYWDLSFSANLKAYIEQICVVGLTFAYNEQDEPYSMCKARELIFVTTAGGEILSDEFGFGYLRAVAKTFFHIPKVYQFRAQRLDLRGENPDRIMAQALDEIDRYFSDLRPMDCPDPR